MIKSVKFFALLAAMMCSTQVEAGCGLFRRGGCSDPCTAGACAGVAFHRGSCGGCASMGGVVHGYSAPVTYQHYSAPTCQNYVPSSYVQSGYVQSTVVQHAYSAPVVQHYQNNVVEYAHPAINAATIQRQDLVDCGPVASYQVVMQTEYVTETRQVPVTEYRDEVRHRTRVISRQVPVEVKDFRTKTVMVPKTETKTVEYNVLVPQQQEKVVQVSESVPVWSEVQESYTVKVPNVVDVNEQYTVRVPQLRDENFTYTVQVPQTQTEQRVQRVTNAIPVSKSRVVQVPRPVTRTQTVTRDHGHWEMRVEEVGTMGCSASAPIAVGGCGTATTFVNNSECGVAPVYSYRASGCGAASGCGTVVTGGCGCGQLNQASHCGQGCGGCGSIAVGTVVSQSNVQVPQTVSRRVWVPNVVTEEVAVVENVMESQEITYTAFEQQTTEVPYECVSVVYVPEQRTGTRKVVDYVEEARTRTRKVVQYTDETRTRSRKELSYKLETREQKFPFVSYNTEKRTKEMSFTVNVPETLVEPVVTTKYDTVQEEVAEEYTVKVPYTTYREQQVQVAKVVPKLVPITINPCQSQVSSSAVSYGTSIGYGTTVVHGQPIGPIGPTGCGCGTPTLAPATCNR